jgi:hypothetical protein
MRPGLAAGGGSGDDLRFDGLLLRAHGTRRSWSYRWRANWSYTYWRPSSPATTPADATPETPQMAEESFEEDVELVVDSEKPDALPQQVVVQTPKEEPVEPTPALTNGQPENDLSITGKQPVTITIKMG